MREWDAVDNGDSAIRNVSQEQPRERMGEILARVEYHLGICLC